MSTGGARPSASVIVSTYDRLEGLELALAGFERQSRTDFELLVADDGSGPKTASFLETTRRRSDIPLQHVRQEDRGFRKSRILNEAVARARADYLVFSDGDCIPHPRFVESHLGERDAGVYLVGRSVLMSRGFCRSLDTAAVRSGMLDGLSPGLILDGILGQGRRVEYGFRPPFRSVRRLLASFKSNRALFGGNFSLWRSDFLAVNGFEEEFTGWGAEDEELGLRLRNAGLEPRPVVWSAINYHYWHPRGHVRRSDENERRMEETRRSGRIRARRGVDGHLEESSPSERGA